LILESSAGVASLAGGLSAAPESALHVFIMESFYQESTGFSTRKPMLESDPAENDALY